MAAFPTRSQVLEKLEALELGLETREAVSTWAMEFVLSDEECDDPSLWSLLTNLGSADLHGLDRPYLYANADFWQWRAEFKGSGPNQVDGRKNLATTAAARERD